MRNKIILIILFLTFFIFAKAEQRGIFMLSMKNIKGDYNQVCDQVKQVIQSNGFNLLADREVATPDITREDGKNLCGYKGKIFIFSSDDYVKMLTSFGNKYLVASFIRIGIYETNDGIQVIIADPETINRIVFNDLDVDPYNKAVNKTLPYKKKIIDALHSLNLGTNVEESREPKRDADDLREASKDMFMMVGDMTFFEDEDQFPVIYFQNNDKGIDGLEKLKQTMYSNIKKFTPVKDDKEYRFTKKPDEDLKWKIVGEVYSPDKKAVLFGLMRNRTEAVSFYIVGKETDQNKCPGIDHLTSYPIEVLTMINEDKITVQTPREMFRMDMFFWDAGMSAFMNHMSMPGILDDSIYRALFGKDKD
jgi:hypothetical protein